MSVCSAVVKPSNYLSLSFHISLSNVLSFYVNRCYFSLIPFLSLTLSLFSLYSTLFSLFSFSPKKILCLSLSHFLSLSLSFYVSISFCFMFSLSNCFATIRRKRPCSKTAAPRNRLILVRLQLHGAACEDNGSGSSSGSGFGSDLKSRKTHHIFFAKSIFDF